MPTWTISQADKASGESRDCQRWPGFSQKHKSVGRHCTKVSFRPGARTESDGPLGSPRSEEARIAVLAHGGRVDAVGSASVRSWGSVALSKRSARDAVSKLLRGRRVVLLTALRLGRRDRESTADREGLGSAVVHAVHAVDAIVVSRGQDGRVVRHASDLERANRHLSLVVVCSRYLWGATATRGVVGRHLALNLAAVRSLADGRQDRTDGVDHFLLHVRSGMVQSGLDNVVGIGIADEAFHLARGQELFNNDVLGVVRGAAEALLNDVGAELVAGQLRDPAPEFLDTGLREHELVQVDDVLNNVVAKRILNQRDGVLGDALDQKDLLVARCMINAALEHAAAVTVGAHFNAAVANRVEDELRIEGTELVEALLDDMVAVQILNKLDNPAVQGIDNELDLVLVGQVLNHLLQGTRSMLVQSDANHVLGGILHKDRTLVVVAVLEKLLTQIIAKRIGHELDDVGASLEPDHVDLVGVAVLELLLQKAATVLVLAKLVDAATIGLKRLSTEATHGWGEN